MSEEIKHDRRRFLATAAMTLAATHLGMFRSADAQSRKTEPGDVQGANTSFGLLKQINAGVLTIGYAEAGPTQWSCRSSSARMALRHSQPCS
jgi:hypothetical protein